LNKPVLILVTPGFPKDEQDTACLPAFQQFALSIKEQFPQYQLIILSFQYPFEARRYTWKGIEVIALGGKNRNKLFRVFIWMAARRALEEIRQAHQVVGLISLWMTECALVANRFAKKNQLKHLIWIIGQDAKAGNSYVRRTKPEASQLIAMSDFLKDEFHKNYGIAPAHVMENGIKASAFPELNRGERTIDVFGAGSLIPLKNYSLFIGLIAELKEDFPQIRAQIAGGGEEQQKLQSLINELKLENNVTLLGSLSHTETLLLMNQSKVFLHTSHYEGNSTVLMEALYSGCRVLSTCALSHKETQNLFVSTDRNALRQILISVLGDKEYQVSRMIFNTMDETARRMVGLFH
jgi:glycosyltransferase involved in cell wall biosynthesis